MATTSDHLVTIVVVKHATFGQKLWGPDHTTHDYEP
uniref:Uncharacterized protein n=1 Tax=Rhizophora mucronata TaxID=61149 RepID=A0A2P2PJ01_RHIMU